LQLRDPKRWNYALKIGDVADLGLLDRFSRRNRHGDWSFLKRLFTLGGRNDDDIVVDDFFFVCRHILRQSASRHYDRADADSRHEQ